MSGLKPVVIFGRRIRIRAFLRDIRVAFRTLVGATAGDRRLLAYIANRRDLAAGISELYSEMPEATVVDHSVTECRADDWRKTFAARLQGQGVEIGPLHRRLVLPDGVSALALDHAPREVLQQKNVQFAHLIGNVDIIDDAETLATVADARFDFLAAAHVFEHMRNPIAALAHWLRVVRPGGLVYLVVPDKRLTFDRHRVRTTLEHHILDYRQPSAERDLQHYLDYALLVDGHGQERAVEHAHRLAAADDRIHFHTFIPEDLMLIVRWMTAHVTPVGVEMGPTLSLEDQEFHLLLRKPASWPRAAPPRAERGE
jgi:predicted SAM-dependent methyltransferase